jgi:hypothetical protein
VVLSKAIRSGFIAVRETERETVGETVGESEGERN